MEICFLIPSNEASSYNYFYNFSIFSFTFFRLLAENYLLLFHDQATASKKTEIKKQGSQEQCF